MKALRPATDAERRALRRMMRDLNGIDLTPLLRVASVHTGACTIVRGLVRQVDLLGGLLFMLGASEIEPEDEVRIELRKVGLELRPAPVYVGLENEAGDHASEE